MIALTPEEHDILYRLQRPLPLVPQPFVAVATELNTSEAVILSLLSRLREAQIVRRIGGVFDSRRLGYRSCLFGVKTTPETIEATAKRICLIPGVTHAYARGWPQDLEIEGVTVADYVDHPDFWYTLSAHRDDFDAQADQLADLNPISFPATRRFKIDVVFDLRNRSRDERTEYVPAPIDAPEFETLSSEQIRLIQAFQENLPEASYLYRDAAEVAGWTEEAALEQLWAWQQTGVMRRLSLLLYHRATGFVANGMCCWSVVDEAESIAAGRALAATPEVTHCYKRPFVPNFPFNMYAMIHDTSYEAAFATCHTISQAANLPMGKIFFSLVEYKKTSIHFF